MECYDTHLARSFFYIVALHHLKFLLVCLMPPACSPLPACKGSCISSYYLAFGNIPGMLSWAFFEGKTLKKFWLLFNKKGQILLVVDKTYFKLVLNQFGASIGPFIASYWFLGLLKVFHCCPNKKLLLKEL